MDNTSKVWDVNRYKRKPTESFSNDVGDGNENVKKAIGLLRKTTLHVHHTFFFGRFIAVSARLVRENT